MAQAACRLCQDLRHQPDPGHPARRVASPKSTIDPSNRGKVPGHRRSDGLWMAAGATSATSTMARAKIWDRRWARTSASAPASPACSRSTSTSPIKDDAEQGSAARANDASARACGAPGRPSRAHQTAYLLAPRRRHAGARSTSASCRATARPAAIQFLGPGRYFNVHGTHPQPPRSPTSGSMTRPTRRWSN